MSVLDRTALEASPLADLHTVASELSIDGYRRLRRAELIAAILHKQDGTEPAEEDAATDAITDAAEDAETEASTADTATEGEDQPEGGAAKASATDADDEAAGTRRRRGRRGGRGRAAARDEDQDAPSVEEEDAPKAEKPKTERTRAAKPRTERARSEKARAEKAEPEKAEPEAEPEPDEEQLVEGVVELLGNGSGFVRVDPPEPSDEDVYISSAQVKRCELVSGDRVAGPKRAPRRSERFASLIRIETINGRPAAELADSVRFDDLPAAFPTDRLKVGSDDPTLKAIEWLTPFGKGSRVVIVGPARSGKTEALRRLTAAFAGREELTLTVVLAGVRPEEITEWAQGPVPPVAAVSFAASEDAQNAAIEPVIDQARRLAARGVDAVVLIDGLDGCSPQIARKALAGARNLVDSGSVTVIATASAPIGGETTVIALDVALASTGRFPALDLVTSGTVRPELLVGQPGADAIARIRAEAAEDDDGGA
jgi:transcription termination factor Rho